MSTPRDSLPPVDPFRRTLPVAEMASVVRAARGLLRQYRAPFGQVVGLHAVAALVGLAAPFVIGRLVDDLTAGRAGESLDRLVAGLAAAIVVQTVLVWAARRASFRLGERVFAQLREEFMTRVVALPLSTVERAGTGDLVARTTNDVEALSHVVRFGVPAIFVAVVTVVVTAVAAFLTGGWVAAAIVVGVPMIWASTRWYLRYAPEGYLR
ncbi:MAG TPA: ABC transporter transmembrane domain-containing protein, partial [Dermatophilaceae bacterium]|nr:ABC transporter transmembrane domain-containing protein [Dermatophilaceae bacterium]